MHPFKEYGTVKADYERYELTLQKLPKGLKGTALDLGVPNPFTPLLQGNYPALKIVNTSGDLDFDTDPFPYSDNSFDIIFSFEVLEHLMNPLWNLLECRRVLKENGIIYLTTPKGGFPPRMWMDTHFHEIDAKRIEILADRAKLKIIRFEKFNKSPLYWWKMGLIRPTLRVIWGGWFYLEMRK